MHEYRHTHTHIATQVKQYSHKQRGEPESRRQSSPRGAPSSYLHPSSSFSLLGWGGGYTGVTCLLLKVSKHPGESLFTPLKEVGIPISRRPSSPSATHGCRGDEKRNQEAATATNQNFFFFFGLPSCWCLRLFNTFTLLSLAYLRFSFCLFSSLLAHSGPTSTPNLHALIPFI